MSEVVLFGVLNEDGSREPYTELVSCNHCGIVVADPRDFGWVMWHHDEDVVFHHCPAAQQYNGLLAGGLIHGTDPNDAVIYEDWPD